MKFQLRPLHNAESTASGPFQWLATTNDPQFWIRGWKKMVGRHVSISFQIQAEEPLATSCVLYYDVGQGMNEATTIHLAIGTDGSVKQEIQLPFNTVALRLDPIAQSGRFSILNFNITLRDRVVPFVYHRPRRMHGGQLGSTVCKSPANPNAARAWSASAPACQRVSERASLRTWKVVVGTMAFIRQP